MNRLIIVVAVSTFVPGCATKQFRADCEARYPEAAEAINQCIDRRKEDVAAEARARREDREAEKAACLWPAGVWVTPPGYCRKTTMY